ncbi:tautomerase family protein [Ruixingdingia sedimenti]|uniref:Tautomerase n=1 Tax=Ruixingdingia sedimenti TaxID=3073604 RepID=A0ABU1F429_9RHOB|nr:4-oxalocrotonate tautomerase family protein [Xinfangfangia sp. LG-4]MDR5651619.1 4-oxalocrotonate tautomerase family protein [Xinfangfangia sp. LG-4]
MPMVEVKIKAGRTIEQKREIALRMTEVLVEVCGSARDRVHVIITEVGEDNWGRGGRLLSDIG